MPRQKEVLIDRQVVPTETGTVKAIELISNPRDKKIAILDRKVKAKLMRAQITHYGPTGWNLLEIDVNNTRARKAERETQEAKQNLLGAINVPVHLNWEKVNRIATLPVAQNGKIPVPYGTY